MTALQETVLATYVVKIVVANELYNVGAHIF